MSNHEVDWSELDWEMAAPEVREYEQYGPWGTHGHEVGSLAVSMLEELWEPKHETRPPGGEAVEWDHSDSTAFARLFDLDRTIELIQPAPVPIVDGGQIGRLYETFAHFHRALPLTEAERTWLFFDWHRQRSEEEATGDSIDTIKDVVAEVLSEGVVQVIHGREIVRRWWSWRRETDEFAGQGSLDEARRTLKVIADTLVLDRNWPRTGGPVGHRMDYVGPPSIFTRPGDP